MTKAAATAATAISWSQVFGFRMARQYLTAPAAGTVEVARDLFGLHAQVMSSAELTVGVRTRGLTRADVAGALVPARKSSKPKLVKTWAMRGTLHLLAASDFPLLAAASTLRDHWLKPAWLKAFGVTRAELLALVDAVPNVLDGKCLTRQQLTDALIAELG